MNFDQLVDRIVSEFDVTTTVAAAWVNERQARMVSEALYRAAKKSLGTTVAGQSNYVLPTDVVDLKLIRIEDSSGDVGLYEPTSLEQLWNLDAAGGYASSRVGGIFAEDYQADGDVEIRLVPTPETSGLDITGLQVLQPATLTYGGSSALIIPVHLHTYLLSGARADGYDDEGRQDLAQKYEQEFSDGVEKLRRYKNTRTGPGSARVQVAGYDY